MSYRAKEELNILLTEYQTLKEEEKSIFSFQFTVIGIWIAFLGVMIGALFNQIESIEKYAYENYIDLDCTVEKILRNVEIMSQSRTIIILLIAVLIPGTCALFGLIWLDLTTRFIKEAHYIFIIEHKILTRFPDTIGFDHFLFYETKNAKGLMKTNYVYYFIMLGIMILCPVLIVYFHFSFGYLYKLSIIHIFCFLMIEGFTVVSSIFYVKRILSYAKEKKEMME